jgi:hypothetical protein
MNLRFCAWMLLAAGGFFGAACGGDDGSGSDNADTSDVADVEDHGETADVPEATDVPETTDVPVDVPGDVPDDAPADAPPPDPCATYCDGVMAAACSGGPPDRSACISGCNTLMVSCAAPFDALVARAGDAPTITCDATGTPVVDDCLAEHMRLLGCAAGGPCGAYCGQAVTAGCSLGPDSLRQCLRNCEGLGAVCPTEFEALTACGGDAMAVACDAAGYPVVGGCGAEFGALLDCSMIEPCTTMCGPVVAAACTAGPPDEASCVGGCSAMIANGCAVEFAALMTCAGADPLVLCSGSGQPSVTGCESQNIDFVLCGSAEP